MIPAIATPMFEDQQRYIKELEAEQKKLVMELAEVKQQRDSFEQKWLEQIHVNSLQYGELEQLATLRQKIEDAPVVAWVGEVEYGQTGVRLFKHDQFIHPLISKEDLQK